MTNEPKDDKQGQDLSDSDFCTSCGNSLDDAGMCSGCGRVPDECDCPSAS